MFIDTATPIAIIGIGCRFPGGANTPAQLWQLLLDGRDTVSTVPPDRWDAATLMSYQHPDDAERYRRGCFLDGDIWAWEPAALSVAQREGIVTDPQHRVATEVAWEAVEHAGIPIADMRGTRTGVYLGMFAPDSLLRSARPVRDWIDGYYIFGNFAGNAPGRITFALDLRGPAMAVESLCSSGLVAVHQACQSLSMGESDMALAGAVLLMSSPETMHYEAKWLTSQRGRCFAFDERADGYVRGEGCAVLLLRRLEDAIAQGNRVLAVIRGSAVTCDGQSERLTAPSTVMQQEAFRLALARSGVEAGSVGLVEAHGPGTFQGDPIEYTSINAVYGRGRGRCALGSIKTNIGHSEPTSGLAGLIKAAMAVRHGVIPPNLHFRGWNPSIPLDPESRLFVPTSITEWPVEGGRRLAAVCSYGLSGTNAHVVVEQPPEPAGHRARRARKRSPAKRVFVLSATVPEALPDAARRLADWVAETRPSVADVAHTLSVRRSHGVERLAVPAESAAQLVDRLRAFADGEVTEVATGHPVTGPGTPGPVLVFPGQGSEWPGMCRTLLDHEPAFTAAIDELEPLITAETGVSVRSLITDPARVTPEVVQPLLFATQLALQRMWASWGVTPAAVIGQSMGEVAAAVVAGALSMADAAAVICRRARIALQAGGGGMASVLLDAERVEHAIAEAGADGVSIAVLAAPESTVISGDRDQVAALVAMFEQQQVSASLLSPNYASHCAHMDPVLPQIRQALAALTPVAPRIPFYTTTLTDPRATVLPDADYWASNLREPVRFHDACRAALHDGHRLFIECTPHPVAVRAIKSIADRMGITDVAALGTLRRDADAAFTAYLAAAHCAGAEIDWESHYHGELVDAPTTTWHRSHLRFDPPYELVAPDLVGARQHSLLGGYVQDPDRPARHLWQTPISPARVPWLADHRVGGVPVLAGAGLCEMLLSAAVKVFGTDHVTVSGLQLTALLLLEPEPTVRVQADLAPDGTAAVRVTSGSADGRVVHAHGTISADPIAPTPEIDSAVPAGDGHWDSVNPADLYAYFRERHDVVHGPAFAGLERIQLHRSADRAVVRLRIPDEARVSAWMMSMHPALLDSVVQGVCSVWREHYHLEPGPVVVAGFDRVEVFGPTGRTRNARLELTEADELACVGTALLTDDAGTPLAKVVGVRVTNITSPAERFAARLSHLAWPLLELATSARPQPGNWLVFGEEGDPWPVELTDVLARRGAKPTLFTRQQFDAAGDDLLAAENWTAVVLAIGSDGAGEPDTVARRRVARLCAVARGISTITPPPRLWVAASTEPAGLRTAGIRGVLRTAAYEYPSLASSLVEVDTAAGPERAVDEMLADDPTAREIRWQGAQRRIAHLREGAPESDAGTKPAGVHSDGAYIVTGGLGGLGLQTARWLAERGAGRVVLNGRRAATAEAAAVLDTVRRNDTDITIVLGDIGDPCTVDNAIAAAVAGGLKLRGVVHAATILDDALLDDFSEATLERVWRGKATGAWRLHTATLTHELDFWVVYSSLAALVGSPGQASYAAANAWLDDLVAWRRAHGLPATAIQWGAWSTVGAGQSLARRGFTMIRPADGIDALARILEAGYSTVCYSPLEIIDWLGPYPQAATAALYSELLDHSGPEEGAGTVLAELLAAPDDGRRRELLRAHVIDTLRETLGATTQHITATTSMVMLGVDSLAAMQLRQRLQRSLNISIDTAVLWTKPTAAGITDWILQNLGYGTATAGNGLASDSASLEGKERV